MINTEIQVRNWPSNELFGATETVLEIEFLSAHAISDFLKEWKDIYFYGFILHDFPLVFGHFGWHGFGVGNRAYVGLGMGHSGLDANATIKFRNN